ncbi:MAG: SAF domain-containing protein, partial [Desulfitobacteriaceae bacterium]
MARKGFVFLALISALIAAGSAFLYLNGLNKKNALELRALVVAKSEIAARSVLTTEQLTLKEVPVKGYPQGGISSVQGLVGSVALVNLKSGDPVLSSMVERSNTGGEQSKGTNT